MDEEVNLLRAHCTLCLGSKITHISSGQHTDHRVGICRRHTHADVPLCSQTRRLLLSGERFTAGCVKSSGCSWTGLGQSVVVAQHPLYFCCLQLQTQRNEIIIKTYSGLNIKVKNKTQTKSKRNNVIKALSVLSV